jgi:DNA-binding PadR family transcriptional regulator
MYRFDMLLRVIDMAVLGLLQDQDLHGYELRKRLTALVGLRGAISFGSLYPALGRLEATGAVKAVEANDADRAIPMTGSLSGEASAFLSRRRTTTGRNGRAGRARKVYGITEHGRELLVTLLEDPASDDKAFPLKVALCAALAPARRLELFERRRSSLATQLATARAGRKRNTERVDGYLRALREHDNQTIEHEIAWLDGLIAAEREHLRAEGPVTSQEDTTE